MSAFTTSVAVMFCSFEDPFLPAAMRAWNFAWRVFPSSKTRRVCR